MDSNKVNQRPMPADQAACLEEMRKTLSENYRAALSLYEQLSCLSELAGWPENPRRIEFSEDGAAGLQRILQDLARLAGKVTVDGLYDFQLDELVEKGLRRDG